MFKIYESDHQGILVAKVGRNVTKVVMYDKKHVSPIYYPNKIFIQQAKKLGAKYLGKTSSIEEFVKINPELFL
jgi:hypothetical protein